MSHSVINRLNNISTVLNLFPYDYVFMMFDDSKKGEQLLRDNPCDYNINFHENTSSVFLCLPRISLVLVHVFDDA